MNVVSEWWNVLFQGFAEIAAEVSVGTLCEEILWKD